MLEHPDVVTAGIEAAARAIAVAPALVVAAGAGMGVDSGLPDFRGDKGFWRAYPPFEQLGLRFVDLANPRWFSRDPELAWGFYGHRLNLYRHTQPHEGFAALLRMGARTSPGAGGVAVFTSNVDGQFQRAGFAEERIVECHGSIHMLQCTEPCSSALWSADTFALQVDPQSFRATSPLPRCPRCGALARPNILMFGDGHWIDERTTSQEARLDRWLRALPATPVVIELGAGTAVPSVRAFAEEIAARRGGHLVRINVREPEVPRGHLGIALGAREALSRIEALL